MRAGQSQWMSVLEAVVNTVVGFVGAVLIVHFFFPLSTSQNVSLVTIMTVYSIARGIAVRRFFNWLFMRYS